MPVSKSRRSTRWPLIALALVAASCTMAQTPEGYEAAARAARHNREVPANSVYHKRVARDFRVPVQRAALRCARRIAETRPASILLRLDASGSASQFMIYPDADYGRCVYEKVENVAVLHPPQPGYWISIQIPSP